MHRCQTRPAASTTQLRRSHLRGRQGLHKLAGGKLSHSKLDGQQEPTRHNNNNTNNHNNHNNHNNNHTNNTTDANNNNNNNNNDNNNKSSRESGLNSLDLDNDNPESEPDLDSGSLFSFNPLAGVESSLGSL